MCIPGLFGTVKQPKIIIPPAPPMPRQPEPMPEIKGIELGTIASKRKTRGRELLMTRGLRKINSTSVGLNSSNGSSSQSNVGLNTIGGVP